MFSLIIIYFLVGFTSKKLPAQSYVRALYLGQRDMESEGEGHSHVTVTVINAKAYWPHSSTGEKKIKTE